MYWTLGLELTPLLTYSVGMKSQMQHIHFRNRIKKTFSIGPIVVKDHRLKHSIVNANWNKYREKQYNIPNNKFPIRGYGIRK